MHVSYTHLSHGAPFGMASLQHLLAQSLPGAAPGNVQFATGLHTFTGQCCSTQAAQLAAGMKSLQHAAHTSHSVDGGGPTCLQLYCSGFGGVGAGLVGAGVGAGVGADVGQSHVPAALTGLLHVHVAHLPALPV